MEINIKSDAGIPEETAAVKEETENAGGITLPAAQTPEPPPTEPAGIPDKKNALWTHILAFLIPAGLLALAFAINKIVPFYPWIQTDEDGVRSVSDSAQQMLNFDLWHQYYPFLQIFREKLAQGGSMFYTWVSGLGSNFLSMIGYYIASPLNLLTFLVPAEYLRHALAVFTVIKIGCAGLFFSIFARKVFRRADFLTVSFSCLYALCAYSMGYYWNVIWLDTFALFPLVMLGALELFCHSRFKLYTLTLALSIIANYYIGYMVCVSVVIAFIAYTVIYRPAVRVFFKKLGQFFVFSALGCMMSAFIALPCFVALGSAHGSTQGFSGSLSLYRGFEQILATLLPFHEPTAIDGLPNTFCGLATVILCFVYFWNTRIALREKMAALGVTVFLILSMNLNVLDFFWHGMHFPNQVPFRFSFVLSFALLFIALRALTKTDRLDKWDVVGTSVFAVLLMGAAAVSVFGKDKIFSGGAVDAKIILAASAFLCVFYVLILALRQKKYVNSKAMAAILGLVIFAEILPQPFLGVKAVGATSYKFYKNNASDVTGALNYAAGQDDDDGQFYRADFVKGWSCNDPALYMYDGVSQFSSAANAGVTHFMHGMGFPADEASNRYGYVQNTPVATAFLNVKYLLSSGSARVDPSFTDKLTNRGNISVYRNTRYLPLGFMTGSGISELKPDDINVFANQNRLFSLATGLDKDVLINLELVQGDSKTVTIKPVEEGDAYYGSYNVRYDTVTGSSQFDLTATATVPVSGPLYGYFTVPGASNGEILRNGSSVCTFTIEDSRVDQQLNYLGEFSAGDTVTFSAAVDSVYINGYCNLWAAVMDKNVFEEGFDLLNDEIMVTSEFSDTRIKGSVNALSDGVLYTSIPYETGWTVTVDGKKAETVAVGGAFVGVELKAGEHELIFSYVPAGFILGLAMTLFALAAFIVLCAVTARRPLKDDEMTLPMPAPKQKNKAPESEAAPESADVTSAEAGASDPSAETGSPDQPESEAPVGETPRNGRSPEGSENVGEEKAADASEEGEDD